MAVQDEDWQKFLDSTQEPDEEVETDIEDAEDEPDEEDGADDKKKKPSDSSEESDPNDPEEGDDPEEEEDPDNPDDEEEDPADDYKPRLKQFIKKDGSFDTKGIEDAYVKSGKEAVKLNNDLKEVRGNYSQLLAAIKAKPDAAKAIFGDDGAKQLLEDDRIPTGGGSDEPSGKGKVDVSSHPLLAHLDAQMKNQSRKEYDDFVEANPEAVTDPERADKIGEFLQTHGEIYRRQHNGEIPSMKESLEAAYRYYGWDLADKKKEELATATKRTAATRRSGNAKKPATKKQTAKAENFFASKLGVKL